MPKQDSGSRRWGTSLLGLSLALVVLTTLACGQSDAVSEDYQATMDWVPFIQFDDIRYLASSWAFEPGVTLDAIDPGPEFARVRFKLAGNVFDPSYRSKDGDAAFIEPGTPVYSVEGYDPRFLLATVASGRIVMLYEADRIPGASRGSVLLDIGGKVSWISINSPVDGKTEVGRIDDPEAVAAVVDAVMQAPVHDDGAPRTEGDPYFVAFHLQDGIVVRRAYWADSGELQRDILLPQSARELIRDALGKP